ncbi:MAG: hypothetical protein KKE02_12515 [Alphaproteobacteria bacterium]|nr:hypothetical protein [Alphaproteobacteria bacterium]MBU1512652.1 hypothetical protein [Alphaproteobacteria bacterium]MBU2095046.1 hypothetical protein [Alphaproteobacteria bacterium]MBU2151835.1 hypothetical protein [Alphaproteobacteria bacterium]MBU2306234.1 hypothetical protein [Alphaproteobacteria bacterium]
MLSRLLAVLAAILAMGSPARAAPGLALVDLTPQFSAAWDATAALPDAERPAAFRARMAQAAPGFYPRETLEPTAAARYDERLLRRLKTYPEDRAGIAAVSRNFDAMFRAAGSGFEARFGRMVGYPPVYLLHSLGEFDGGTREMAGRATLLFGADMIVRYHGNDDLQPFFHHELFHLLHQRTFKECAQVWCSLWTEGLAVYVAATLNPKATDSELLLVQPEPIRAAVDRDRKAAVCAAVARLDSTDAADQEALFSFRRLSPELPPRFGYYVGYLAAADLGKRRSLNDLAALDNAAVRPLLERSLRSLADCPA